jgi:hypothetical protein
VIETKERAEREFQIRRRLRAFIHQYSGSTGAAVARRTMSELLDAEPRPGDLLEALNRCVDILGAFQGEVVRHMQFAEKGDDAC